MIKLGVNIDHIATLRNARGDFFPSIAVAAGIVEQSGADFITIHLREDRRHIRDEDLTLLKGTTSTYLNLEMACNDNILEKALKTKPRKVTIVPEKRDEKTTEGGLNVIKNFIKIRDYVKELKNQGIIVSLFVEPNINLLDKILETGATELEIHTGKYSLSTCDEQKEILKSIYNFSTKVKESGLTVCAGHGLNYHNVTPICLIKEISELNIGYSIITKALFVGLENAVRGMKNLIYDSEMMKCTE